jgi:hypothetical protein
MSSESALERISENEALAANARQASMVMSKRSPSPERSSSTSATASP